MDKYGAALTSTVEEQRAHAESACCSSDPCQQRSPINLE